jgi:hypothetical protein
MGIKFVNRILSRELDFLLIFKATERQLFDCGVSVIKNSRIIT